MWFVGSNNVANRQKSLKISERRGNLLAKKDGGRICLGKEKERGKEEKVREDI